MTNEEYALSLSRKYATPKNKNREVAVYQSCIEMAEWKNQKFEDYLKKRVANLEYFCSFAKTDISIAKLKIEVYEDILNELFITDSYDYSDNDE